MNSQQNLQEKVMNRKLCVAAATLMLCLGAAHAAPGAEDAMEAEAGLIRFPADGSSKMSASSCGACPSLQLEMTPTATFIVNGRAIPLTQLRAVFARDSSLQVVVAYYSASKQLSRIIVTGQVRQ
jgi:hypothetical protein